MGTSEGPKWAGTECGFMISGEVYDLCLRGYGRHGRYGDNNDPHTPDIASSQRGPFHYGYETRRIRAAKFFDFKTIIPRHYKTFPLLEQSAEELIKPYQSNVIEPEVMVAIDFLVWTDWT